MLSPNGITTIFFDLDGTLRHNQPSGHQFLSGIAKKLGVQSSNEDIIKAQRWGHLYWADSEIMLEDMKTWGLDNEEFWKRYTTRYLEALGCTAEQAMELGPIVQTRMREDYKPEDVVPPDVPETLQLLQEAGYNLGLVTNRPRPVDDYLKEIKLYQYFSIRLAGGEIKAWKPKPKIFEVALERAQARPEQTVYVGDNYYADVIGARGVNIEPILLDPEGIFPQPDCEVIENIAELPDILPKLSQS
ncbi:MAG: HAD family hydrolase [Chloroflexi bacterium]|nr:HAD family hydrolase [Chloroflexota bacterium]